MSDTKPPFISFQNIRKEFPTRAEPLVVLRDASLQLAAGENAAILGPSGSGKSTLMHIIGGLDRPTSGSVKLAGQDPATLDEVQLAIPAHAWGVLVCGVSIAAWAARDAWARWCKHGGLAEVEFELFHGDRVS